jgi:Ser/Thr protein kinase RdoA (MazF antagonist)
MEIDVATELVRRALPLYGMPEGSAVAFVKYRENHVFRVDAPDGLSVAVRLHRVGYHDEQEILTELSYLDALGRAGVPVPEVLRTRDGRLVCTVSKGEHSRSVSVQRWISDAVPFGDAADALSGRHDPPARQFRDIGGVIARLHRAAAEIGRPSSFRRAAWDADGLAGDHPLWGDPTALRGLTPRDRESIARAKAHVHRRLRGMAMDPDLFGVIHADATPENVLFAPDGVVLIDFDDFGTGWYVFDLVTALFHHARNPRYGEFERALRDGYAGLRPLREVEESAWDDFMLARGLTYLGWAAERPGDPASEFIAGTVAPWVARIADALVEGEPAPWRTAPDSERQDRR